MNLTINKNLKTKAVLKNWTAVAIVMIVFLSSCRKNDPVYMNSFTQDYTVRNTDWKKGTDDANNPYLYYEFKEPNLTQEIYNYGNMQAYLVVNMNDGSMSPLPFDDFWIDDTGYKWTEHVTCEFRPGYMTFILKYDDLLTDNPPYFDYTFRVRFTW